MSWTTINLWLFNSKETVVLHGFLTPLLTLFWLCTCLQDPMKIPCLPPLWGYSHLLLPFHLKTPPTLLWLPSLYLESFCINGTCWEQPFLTAPFKAFLYRSSKGAHTFTVKYQNPWWFYICSGVVTMFPVDCIVNQGNWLSWLFTGSVFHE